MSSLWAAASLYLSVRCLNYSVHCITSIHRRDHTIWGEENSVVVVRKIVRFNQMGHLHGAHIND